MIKPRGKIDLSTIPNEKNASEIPPNHFLCNEEVENNLFTAEFNEKNNSFGSINNSTIISNMFAISGKKKEKIPSKLSITICAGFHKSSSGKGISGNHIIKRDHLKPFNKIYKKDNQWQVLTCVAKQLFADIDASAKNNRISIAWAPEECAYVLVINTKTGKSSHQHVLCTLYLHRNSLLILGTLYTVPEFTAKSVANGNKRYISVPLNESIGQGSSAKIVQEWRVKNNNQIKQVLTENSIQPAKNENTYNQLTLQLLKNPVEDFDPPIFIETASYGELILANMVEIDMEPDEFTSSIVCNINKYCMDIISILDEELSKMNDFQRKWSEGINSLLKLKNDMEPFKKNIKDASIDNPDSLAKYFLTNFSNFTMRLGEYTFDTDKLIYEINEIRFKRYTEIHNKLTVLHNQLVDSRLDDQMAARWENLNIRYIEHDKTYKTMMQIHHDTTDLLTLCKCALLRPMSKFLSHAAKKHKDPYQCLNFMKLIKTTATDRHNEKQCKESGNTKLLEHFNQQLKLFFEAYPETKKNFSMSEDDDARLQLNL
jgi:ssDNA-binding Zn-finger/Zn-ribbon topoisomerase 1